MRTFQGYNPGLRVAQGTLRTIVNWAIFHRISSMSTKPANSVRVVVLSAALVSLGFASSAGAGVIGTQQLINSEVRQQSLDNIELLISRQDVAEQLEKYGVEPSAVLARVNNMTDQEIVSLEGKLSEQVAGGDALAIIGIVFLVLLILEVVGVTDIFKSV
jgi:hypothetical protein